MAMIEVKELEKQKKLLMASYNMWENTIRETRETMANAEEGGKKKYTEEDIEKKIELLLNGEQDIIDKWLLLGGTMEELNSGKIAEDKKETVKKPAKEDKTVLEQLDEVETTKPKVKKITRKEEAKEVKKPTTNTDDVSKVIPKIDDTNPMASYDIIPLPSKGECYPSKQGRIAVSYLTAMDENIIVSPNLYRDNMVLDILLREKIRNTDINPDELLDGDRDAIILFLRSSAYGNMYTVTTTIPETKESFDTQIDLSKIKFKDFTLVGDENGYFDFQLPVSKDNVKFKFLNHGDYVRLAKLDEIEVTKMRKNEIKKYENRMRAYLENDDNLGENERTSIVDALKTLVNWADKCKDDGEDYPHRTTNELEMEIVSINGNSDRKHIHEYISKMPIRDSSALRKYITKNTPGVDYNFEIEKPESLGGGSMKVFLQFDQFIFLADS